MLVSVTPLGIRRGTTADFQGAGHRIDELFVVKRTMAALHRLERLEHEIDRYNDRLQPLNSFVLPGGSELASALHMARTIVRRAERLTVTLHESDPNATNPETIRYLNRLSDLLFVLARVANDNGRKDTLWVPGQSRTP